MWWQRSPLPALGECLGQELPVWQRVTAGSVGGQAVIPVRTCPGSWVTTPAGDAETRSRTW